MKLFRACNLRLKKLETKPYTAKLVLAETLRIEEHNL